MAARILSALMKSSPHRRSSTTLTCFPREAIRTSTLTAVAEHQGTALLYLVDACKDGQFDRTAFADVRRKLANRSDPAWLGVVRPGSLEIFPIGFHEADIAQPVRTIEERSQTAPLFFQSLVHGTFEENSKLHGTDYVYQKIFDLLTQTTNEFVPPEGNGRLDALEVLSMAGRALFFRFLIDRDIVRKSELSSRDGICPEATELKDCFSTAEKAAQTSAWLDATFNGDFLPLIDELIPIDDRAARRSNTSASTIVPSILSAEGYSPTSVRFSRAGMPRATPFRPRSIGATWTSRTFP